jgi:pimeloyl-ACP methyl ester carboxylesterase
MQYEIKENGKFKYVEEGQGEPVMLLHGLFGAMSNFMHLVDFFKVKYKVIVPMLPLYELDIFHTSVSGLAAHVHKFIEAQGYQGIHLLGNSLGGHVGLVHTLKHPEKIKSLILTGSSGLYEHGMGDTYPKRGDYDYIKDKTEKTFYDPNIATKELVDEVYEIVNSRIKAIKIIALAKSAIRNNIGKELHNIKIPTLLIWGNQDIITPPFVGEEFKKLIPQSELYFIDKCGHAPMMEVPEAFNKHMAEFIEKITNSEATT